MNLRDMQRFVYELRKQYGNFWEKVEELLKTAVDCEAEIAPLHQVDDLILEREREVKKLDFEIDRLRREFAALQEEWEGPLRRLKEEKELLIASIAELKSEAEEWKGWTDALKKNLAAIS